MDLKLKFENEREERIQECFKDKELVDSANSFLHKSLEKGYSYNFSWMGRPVIQHPQDIVAMQEIIWNVKPDLIIETGIAHGGSLIMYASFMEMMGIKNGHILGIDIDIREHNRIEIENHSMYKRITMFEGSSISNEMKNKVNEFAKEYKKILVVLDSNHTHEHVLKELEFYSKFVTKDSYCVVFDTVVEDMPEDAYPNRPWGKGNNPKTAVWEFLKTDKSFQIDESIQRKLLITVASDGFLKRVK